MIVIESFYGNVECYNLHLGSLEGRRVCGAVSYCRWREDSRCDCDYSFDLVSGFSSVNGLVWGSNLNHLERYVSV